jgi:PPP family 3-phenylpropionic acid transporter
LQVVSLASVLTFAMLSFARTSGAVVVALVIYTLARSPVGPLLDALALASHARGGAPFGAVRAWGSLGYLSAAWAAGALLAARGPTAALTPTLLLLMVSVACAFVVPPAPPTPREALLPALYRLVREPRVARVLALGVLNQVGLSPYDMLFPTWFARRAGGATAGAAVALGVACEVVVMFWGRSLVAHLGAMRAMSLAFALSALRWALVSRVTHVPTLVAVQCLHGFTFGVYYLAAVSRLDEVAPREVRTSAQGIHHALVFGGGGALSLALAGALGGVDSMATVFTVAAVASTCAALLSLRMRER